MSTCLPWLGVVCHGLMALAFELALGFGIDMVMHVVYVMSCIDMSCVGTAPIPPPPARAQTQCAHDCHNSGETTRTVCLAWN